MHEQLHCDVLLLIYNVARVTPYTHANLMLRSCVSVVHTEACRYCRQVHCIMQTSISVQQFNTSHDVRFCLWFICKLLFLFLFFFYYTPKPNPSLYTQKGLKEKRFILLTHTSWKGFAIYKFALNKQHAVYWNVKNQITAA